MVGGYDPLLSAEEEGARRLRRPPPREAGVLLRGATLRASRAATTIGEAMIAVALSNNFDVVRLLYLRILGAWSCLRIADVE